MREKWREILEEQAAIGEGETQNSKCFVASGKFLPCLKDKKEGIFAGLRPF